MILTLLFHSVYASAIAYLLAHLFGSIGPGVAFFSLLIGALLGRSHAKRFEHTHPDFRFSAWTKGQGRIIEVLLFGFILYIGVRHFIHLLFQSGHTWATLAVDNFGDLPLHINYIRAFAQGLSFPPVNPGFTMEPLRYPIGSDLYNSLWESLGVYLPAHLALTGVLALVAALVFLRSYAGWWGVGAFFLTVGMQGGLGGAFTLFRNGLTHYSHQGIDWKNLFLTVFLTQRGILWALPMGLFLLITVQRHFSGESLLSKKQKTALGLIWGALPLFHLHAFVAVSLTMAGIVMASAIGKEKNVLVELKDFLRSRMAVIAYIPATYLILYSTNFFQKAGVMHWKFGWLAPEGQLFSFLILNFGHWLLLPIFLFVALIFEKRKDLWVEFLVYTALFLLFFNLMLAPWAWDNIKVLIWPYLGFIRLAWLIFYPKIERLGGVVAHAAVAGIFFFSGFVVLLWSVKDHQARTTSIYQTADLASTEGAISDIPQQAVFAAQTTHHHPLTFFGRLRVHGYEGHLWSHGIHSKVVAEKLAQLMNGEEDWLQAAKDLGVTHIFWGPGEKVQYGQARRPWMDVLKNVSRVPEYEIYHIQN